MSQEPRPTGLQIARVAGVPVRLMPSWFFFAFYLVLTGQAVLSNRVGDAEAYGLAAAFVVLLLLSVVLHELGHCLVARGFGLPVRSITVNLLAGFTEITEAPQTPAREYAVAVSGPMVSLLLCAAALAGAHASPSGSIAELLLDGTATTNGAIAALNLLPGLPLDGGRVLRSIVWHLGRDGERATRVSAYAGMAIALVVVPVVVVGVLPAYGIGSAGWFSVAVSALVGSFIYASASQALRRSQLLERLPSVSVAGLARPAIAVRASLPLAEAVRQAQEAGAGALVVVDSQDNIEGLVSEAWVKQVPLERRPWITVGEGARRLADGMRLAGDLAGEALLAVMQSTPASEYLVPGEPLRVLVSADVAAAMTGSRTH